MNPLTPTQVNNLLRTVPRGSTVYLVGAGGCGMSGLGHLLLDIGYRVAGSDIVENQEIRELRARGAEIFIGHAPDQVRNSQPALVAYTSAVHRANPELETAEALQIPLVRRAILLAGLLERRRGVCVAGMHGKTTTAAWLAFTLERLGACPSYAIGALVPQLPRHARFAECGVTPRLSSPTQESVKGTCISTEWGSGEEGRASAPHSQNLFVVEADESDGTLREFHPEHAILLNVDADHLDYYASLEVIEREFFQFATQTRGQVIFCADDARLAELLVSHPRAVSYGFHPLAMYRIEIGSKTVGRANCRSESPNVPYPVDELPEAESSFASDALGTEFKVWHRGESLGEFSTRLIGDKNILNAGAAIALLHQLGFAPNDISEAVRPFTGAVRRQQQIFADDRYRVFDDYGHHPSEIRATLSAFRSLGPRRLLVAFQPHRFTRTQHLLREFSSAFNEADYVWLTDVYPASEPEIPGINSALLADAIYAQGQPVEFISSLGELRASIRAAMLPGDLIVFLGAGADITMVAHALAQQLRDEVPLAMETLFADLSKSLSSQTVLLRNEALRKRTTLRVGGEADIYVEPASETELAQVVKLCGAREVRFTLLGRGSNLLIRDGGIRGVVISLGHASFSRVEVDGERVRCGAGARLKTVAVEARRHGLAGLEFLEGIPGSVGGAMRMNAGAMGSWMFEAIETIRFMDYAGQVKELPAAEVTVEYRGCPLFKNHIALGAVLKGQATPPEVIRLRMDTMSKKRWETQPNQPSAGCIFKNPQTITAGRLIDELGLKGVREGGARVSDVHANFIVNDGTATARDVLQLIERIKQRAKAVRGIELETEVEILGEE